MNQYVTDTRVKKGHIAVSGVPFADEQDVRGIIIPRADLKKMTYREVQELTKSLPGNLAEDIRIERDRE